MTAAPLEAYHLCMVRDEDKTQYLLEEQAHKFHHTLAHLLFIISSVRLYIYMAVALLTIHAKKTDKNYWLKLKRVLKCLKGNS